MEGQSAESGQWEAPPGGKPWPGPLPAPPQDHHSFLSHTGGCAATSALGGMTLLELFLILQRRLHRYIYRNVCIHTRVPQHIHHCLEVLSCPTNSFRTSGCQLVPRRAHFPNTHSSAKFTGHTSIWRSICPLWLSR